jgi:LmbE family N-acetylglucosaminyl deacetylase
MTGGKSKSVAVIVAHPDDETLWAGGTILSHPSWSCFIVSLCRGSDPERAPKFFNALKALQSEGNMGDLDDGPGQDPLDDKEVEQAILDLLPRTRFDLVISHHPSGEYTRHIRHEEVSKAVIRLWDSNKISTQELRTFAYEDGHKKYLPTPVKDAAVYSTLMKRVWLKKFSIITETYGFDQDSWEAKTTPRNEAFRQFTDSSGALKWLNHRGTYQ